MRQRYQFDTTRTTEFRGTLRFASEEQHLHTAPMPGILRYLAWTHDWAANGYLPRS